MSDPKPIFGRYREDGLEEAFNRLGVTADKMSLLEALAVLVNKVADLEERLEAHENAAQRQSDGQPGPEENA